MNELQFCHLHVLVIGLTYSINIFNLYINYLFAH